MLDSPQAQIASHDLTVPKGAIITLDAANGPMLVNNLINHGMIRILSSKKDIEEFSLSALAVVSDGVIISDIPRLTIISSEINARDGKISASDRIVLTSESDLTVQGGTYESEWMDFITPGALKTHADRIDSKVTTIADSVAFGVASGNLTVVESKIAGDPLWYNQNGDLNITPGPTNGDDLYLVATGNITVGAIDTTGGNASSPGRIQIVAGAASIVANGQNPPINNPVMVQCTNCDQQYGALGVNTTSSPTGSVTVNGNVKGQGFSASGQNVTINGNINVTDLNGASGSGNCSISYLNTLSITGSVTVKDSLNAGLTKGFLICLPTTDTTTNTQNVTIGGAIDANVEIYSFGPGAVTVANIVAEQSVTIFSGSSSTAVPVCSGPPSVIANAQLAPRALPASTLTVGDITGAQQFVQLGSSGNISAGTIALPTYSLGAAHQISAHTMAIFANLGGPNTSPVFNAGGGGGNGCGKITVNGIVQGLGGAIAISNPGGISVTTADIKTVSDAVSTPGIFLDAGTATLTLDGGLSVNGTATVRAGYIGLLAGTITVPGAVKITASDTTTGSSEPAPYIAVAASSFPVPGNLTIECNSDQNTAVRIGPTGYVVSGGSFPCSYNSQATGAVNFSGAGNISIAAKSTNGTVAILGTPLTFAAGTVNVEVDGQQGSISIAYAGSPQQQNSLISTGGKVTLNADSANSGQGSVTISADAANITSAFSAHANALNSSSGGFINITTAGGDMKVNTGKGAFNIAAIGMGDGSTGGTVNLTSAGAINLSGSAVSVASSNGPGGNISVNAATQFTLNGSLLADAGTQGKGGTIVVNAQTATFSGTTAVISANGVAGDGGIIQLTSNNAITIGTGTKGAVTLSADSTDGSGGQITATSAGAVTLNAAGFSVNAGTSGAGGQATINGTNITVNGDLTATGPLGTGIIAINGAQVVKLNGNLDVSSTGIGIGGNIVVQGNTLNLGSAATSFKANGAQAGGAGQIQIKTAGGPLTLSNASFSANDGPSATSAIGLITISTVDKLTLTGCKLSAQAATVGGTIGLTSQTSSVSIDSATTIVGGAVTLTQTNSLTNNGTVTGVGNQSTITITDPTEQQMAHLTLSGTPTYTSGGAVINSMGSILIDGNETFTTSGQNGLAVNAQFLSLAATTDSLVVTGQTGNPSMLLNVPQVTNSGLIKSDSLISNPSELNSFSVKATGDGTGGTLSAVGLVLSANGATNKNIVVNQETLTSGGSAPIKISAASAQGNVTITAEDGSLLLTGVSAGASASNPGNISITTASGTIATTSGVASGPTSIIANGGSVNLQATGSNGAVTFGQYTSTTATGKITVAVGSPVTSVPGTANANVDTTKAHGTVFWGNNSIVAAAGSNSSVVSDAGTKLLFSEQPSQLITLQGNDTFTLL